MGDTTLYRANKDEGLSTALSKLVRYKGYRLAHTKTNIHALPLDGCIHNLNTSCWCKPLSKQYSVELVTHINMKDE
jgi:hypothetical protein